MCKRLVCIFLTIILLYASSFVNFAYAENLGFNVSAEAAVLMVAETGEVIFSRNGNKHMPMASTTKIMTSLLALESGRLNEEITVTEEMVKVEGTSMGLLPGDSISVYELVLGMLLESGNDAANVTACIIAGSPEGFAVLMNDKAVSIGMNDTNFVTPSGLDDDEHFSTAHDMALLGSYALKNTEFVNICSSYTSYADYGNPPYRRCLTNHNKLLRTYNGAIGIKTGFTKKSGRCLVSAAQRNGLTLVCATLNAPNDWQDHTKLLDYGFEKVGVVELDMDFNGCSVSVIGSDVKNIKAQLFTKPSVYGINIDPGYKCDIIVERFVYAPVNKGDILGCATVTDSKGKIISEVPIVAAENAELTTVENSVKIKKSFFERIINYLAGGKND